MSAHPFPGRLGDDEGWKHVDSKHGGYSVFTKHIERSQQDDREYRLIRLDNGLQAMLVHDAKADKAAASIDVGVGHLHDPVRIVLARPSFGGAEAICRMTCQVSPTSASTCSSWCAKI